MAMLESPMLGEDFRCPCKTIPRECFPDIFDVSLMGSLIFSLRSWANALHLISLAFLVVGKKTFKHHD